MEDHSVFSWFVIKSIYLKCNRFRLEVRAENDLATARRAEKELAVKEVGGGGGKGGVLCSFAGSFHLLLGAYDSITLFVHSISISLFYTERVPFGYGKHS